jgi:eukaryotic-like serine/threonine-protein kinase
MGEVYRARDTKLGREVALKVLPQAFAADAERMGRFEREAKVLASLNHPSIAAIYGFEDSGSVRALVMELVEGPTLADRIARGPIPVDEALLIAKQIAGALEYAHERGIVHRDLKPANIKVTADDAVKVLDFGLAKALEGDAESVDISSSPTLSNMATQAGIILGTAAYMSPEQAKGKKIDRRTDIWAFGCVLYEMLTGQQAFTGETVTDVLAAIVRAEPDWSQLPSSTPAHVRVLLRRCLQKDPKQRLRDIGDARISLEEVLSGSPESFTTAGISFSFLRHALPWVLGGLSAGALISGLLVWRFVAPASQSSLHFSAITNFAGVQAQPALSPDGRSVAFVSNRDGHYNVYVGLIHGGNLVKVTDDPNLKVRPSWSPEGTELAYAEVNSSGVWDIWEVPALGGTPRRLVLNASDPAWSPDGRSLAYENLANGAIWSVGISGENAHQLIAPPPRFLGTEPRFSPDARKLAYAARPAGGGPYGELAVADLDSGKSELLTHDRALALSPAWSADGRSIYFCSSRGGTLNIWKIDADGGGLRQITAGEGDNAELDVSRDGKQIVFSTLRVNIALAQLDLQAKPGQESVKLLSTDPVRNQFGPAYSLDGKHLAYFSNLKGIEKEAIWVANADGSNAIQLVQDARINIFPRWSPDSKEIIYFSQAAGYGSADWEYRNVRISGGAPRVLTKASNFFVDIGSDGRLLFLGNGGQAETFDPRDGKAQALAALPSGAYFLRWSSDERSIAYSESPQEENDSNSGVWVDDFKGRPRQVFRGWVIWYAMGPGNQIYALQGKPDLNAVLWKVGWNGQGLARTSFSVPLLYDLNYHHEGMANQFDVSPDGRYLVFQTEQGLEENIGMIDGVH